MDGKLLYTAHCMSLGKSKEEADYEWNNWEGEYMNKEQWKRAEEIYRELIKD